MSLECASLVTNSKQVKRYPSFLNKCHRADLFPSHRSKQVSGSHAEMLTKVFLCASLFLCLTPGKYQKQASRVLQTSPKHCLLSRIRSIQRKDIVIVEKFNLEILMDLRVLDLPEWEKNFWNYVCQSECEYDYSKNKTNERDGIWQVVFAPKLQTSIKFWSQVILTYRLEATRGLLWEGPRHFESRSDDET
ncbi:hypothetical protein AVEN_208092-1 [Araneus ventricosus]|uniref:Uncharacterized protein n=1 Tax=Araneus ventricosus TaxID=182803 RepID=A0A4Y2G1M7_ARAVE|nr:hypothetical protein AVEN_208092-1 [Araneus ventricosus]